ncbi:MAG: flagellar basal body rod protein FlgC [Treponemataceae bacterium]
MGLFTSINTASTGMTVSRLRTDVISDNIANASTTRTQDGGPYRRSRVVVEPMDKKLTWNTPFVPSDLESGTGKGVRALKIEKDMSEGKLIYDPSHPDAIKAGPKTGYVEYPNVNIVNEMVDLIAASRSYEANTSVIQGAKEMFNKALEIGR